MPTGMLIFCLDYAAKETEPLSGLFTSIRKRFADLANTNLQRVLEEVYEFRNTYIAHEKKDLTDAETTRTALHRWVDGLQSLYAARQ